MAKVGKEGVIAAGFELLAESMHADTGVNIQEYGISPKSISLKLKRDLLGLGNFLSLKVLGVLVFASPRLQICDGALRHPAILSGHQTSETVQLVGVFDDLTSRKWINIKFKTFPLSSTEIFLQVIRVQCGQAASEFLEKANLVPQGNSRPKIECYSIYNLNRSNFYPCKPLQYCS
ncbi:hypothetical protein BGZ60DRAFT_2273 [Tricladium varicosporioides]|nr:hypothetical protein BGZ60DRAFT_2273 [Hymenoscyphus varicosporioides]